MRVPLAALLAVVSYLVGAIPFAVILAKRRGVDIRSEGSGNPGASNVARILGRPYGYLTFILDAAKGVIPIVASGLVWERLGWDGGRTVMALCGGGAIAGHIWPVYLRFRGGKGVATSIGVVGMLSWHVMAIGIGVWLFGAYVLRYVYMGSALFALSLPVSFLLLRGEAAWGEDRAVTALLAAIAVVVAARHRSNFRRMREGREPRTGERPEEAS